MNYKSISMIYQCIHKQLTTYFKVKYGYILIGYYKSHGSVLGLFRGSVIGQAYIYRLL